MAINKIDVTSSEVYDCFHERQPDVPPFDAAGMKDFFDAMPKKVLIPKLNEVIDELNSGGYGKSAYTIACEQGFKGTEAEWLASLKGEQGVKGDQGLQGPQGTQGETGTQGPKGDPGIIEADSLSSITSSGVYRVNDNLYLASQKLWDTDLCAPFRYTGEGAISPDLNFNQDTSSITGGEVFDGVLLLKYKNIYKDFDDNTQTGATYICLSWDGEMFKTYLQDSPDATPYYSMDFAFYGDEIVDLSDLITNDGVFGLGEDILGNWALVSKYFIKTELDIEKLVTEADADKNALKGTADGSAVLLTDVSPLEHELKVTVSGVEDLTSVTVSRYGLNLFNGERRGAVLGNNTFADYDGAPVNNSAYQSIKIYLPVGTYSLNANIPIHIIRRIIDNKWSQLASMNITHEKFTITQAGYVGFSLKKNVLGVEYPAWVDTDKIWITVGETPTEYEPFVEPVTYTPRADGRVKGIKSIYPSTTLLTDTDGVTVDVTYNRDINKAFAEIQSAIDAMYITEETQGE